MTYDGCNVETIAITTSIPVSLFSRDQALLYISFCLADKIYRFMNIRKTQQRVLEQFIIVQVLCP